MTAQDFLQQAYLAHHEVEIKLEQIAKLQADATRTTTIIKAAPIGGQKSTSRIENAVMKVDEKTRALADEIEKLVEVGDTVHSAILQVDNPTAQLVLKYKYLCFFSWQQISFVMKKSLRQIYRIHNEALEKYFCQCH